MYKAASKYLKNMCSTLQTVYILLIHFSVTIFSVSRLTSVIPSLLRYNTMRYVSCLNGSVLLYVIDVFLHL